MGKRLKETKVIDAKGKTKEELIYELTSEGYNYFPWSDSPGAYYPPHSHEHDECICVISGNILFYVNGKEYELTPGKKLYLPAHTIHEARNNSNQNVTYLVGESG